MSYEHLSRRERKLMVKTSRELVISRPKQLTEIPKARWSPSLLASGSAPLRVWESRKYLAQLYQEAGPVEGRQVTRLSICRVVLRPDGRWEDNLSWDELMQVKRDTGFQDSYALEVYPRDADIVNAANMRHLWLLSWPLALGWFRGR